MGLRQKEGEKSTCLIIQNYNCQMYQLRTIVTGVLLYYGRDGKNYNVVLYVYELDGWMDGRVVLSIE